MSSSFLKPLHVRYYEIDILMDFYIHHSFDFDFKRISKKMEFILDTTESWIDLLDTILYYGNAAFVAFRHLLMLEAISEVENDDGYLCVESATNDLRLTLFPRPEMYQIVTRSQSLTYTRSRSGCAYFDFNKCVDALNKLSVPNYLVGKPCKNVYLIESFPITLESKSDFYTDHVFLPNSRFSSCYIPSTEFDILPSYQEHIRAAYKAI